MIQDSEPSQKEGRREETGKGTKKMGPEQRRKQEKGL